MLLSRLIKIVDHRMPRHGAFSELEARTGISARAWAHVYNQRTKAGSEHLEKLCELFPEYTLWLMTGQVSPEAGQTSPELEQLEELQKSIGK